ncbi:unnamed protein product [Trichobilharzia regenti]|nr:unnamed protein product [Trichobilharzia regenti]
MISYGYKLPKHQLDSQSLINQIASSTSYSSGTGRIPYFGDTHHSDMKGYNKTIRPFHHNEQAYKHIQRNQQQQSTKRQKTPTPYPRKKFYPRCEDRFHDKRENKSK